jgi:hypothetical protein
MSKLSNPNKNSKRYLKLKETYNLSNSNTLNQNFYSRIRTNFPNSKYIVISKPVKASFFKFIPKWLINITIISSVSGLTYYYRKEISDYLKNFQKKNFNEKSKKYINSLLVSEEIKEGGVILLDNIFKNDHSKASTVQLLNNLLEDPKVMDSTKAYGVSLFNQLLQEEELKFEVKKLFVDILASDEIKQEGVQLLKYIIQKEESKDIMAQYFKVIFLRSDIIKSLSNVISDSGIYTMNTPATKKKFAEFVIDVWSDPNLRWYVIKKSLNFWQPAQTTVKNDGLQGDKQVREELTSLDLINKVNRGNSLNALDKIDKV